MLEHGEGERLVSFAEDVGADEAFVGFALVPIVGGVPPSLEQRLTLVEVGAGDRGDGDLGVLSLEAVAELSLAFEVAAGEVDHGLAGVDVIAGHGGG